MTYNLTLGALLLLTIVSAVQGQEIKGAKELFYGTDGGVTIVTKNPGKAQPAPATSVHTKPPENMVRSAPTAKTPVQIAATKPNPDHLGLKTSVRLLVADGSARTVSPSTKFKSGDVIQLVLQSNKPGYLYVINIGSTGKETVLYPSKSTDDNRVQAFQEYVIPARMKFDANAGVEQLIVALSATPTSTVQTRTQGMKILTVSTQPGVTADGAGTFAGVAAARLVSAPSASTARQIDDMQSTSQTSLVLAQASGARDLVLDDSDGALVAVSSMAIGKTNKATAPLVLNIMLAHE